MAKTAKSKKLRPLLGGHPATIRAAVAIKELLKVKTKLSLLGKKRELLIRIIKEEGGGTAHGYRTYISHSPARHYWASKKASDDLKLIAITERSVQDTA